MVCGYSGFCLSAWTTVIETNFNTLLYEIFVDERCVHLSTTSYYTGNLYNVCHQVSLTVVLLFLQLRLRNFVQKATH